MPARSLKPIAVALSALILAAAATLAWAGPAGAATWTPCEDYILQIDCATFDFPIDRTGAVAGTTKVRAIRLSATEGPRMGTLFVIAGGPGQPSSIMLEMMAALFQGANRYDVVAIDQRGTGFSEPLDCPRIETGQFKFDGGDPTTDGAITDCATQLGPARAGYDTAEAVADMDAVRADLGISQISLFGVSYGTKVALAYAQAHPANVKSMIIDSVLPVDKPGAFDVESVDAMRKALAEMCASGHCANVISSPIGKLARLAKLLAASPLPLFVETGGGRTEEAKLDDEALYELMFAADFNLFFYNQLPAAIDGALRGNPAMLARMVAIANGDAGASVRRSAVKRFRRHLGTRRRDAAQLLKPGDRARGSAEIHPEMFSNTLYLATSCEDFTAPWTRGAPLVGRQTAIAAAADAIPDSVFYPFARTTVRNDSLAALCRGYSESADPPAPAGPMPPVPTLALSGTLDVRTPTAWAEQAISGNPNATLVRIPHTGHSTIGTDASGCALSLAKRFLIFGAVDGKCRRYPMPVPVARRAALSLRAVKPMSGRCRKLRRRACTSARQTVTAGYQAMRDALDQLVIGGNEEGPGLYGGSWYLDFEIPDDIFAEDILYITGEDLSQVPGTVTNGEVDVTHYPSISGEFVVTGPSGDYRVEFSGRAAYDQRGDRVVLSAHSGRKRLTLRHRGSGASAATVSKHALAARGAFARATLIRRGLR